MRQHCILLVEPDVLVRSPLAEYLRECGYLVVEATSAEEARTILGQSDIQVDAALIDARRLAESSFALAGWLRNAHPRVKVILAGTVASAAREAGELCEDSPTVEKPYDHRLVLDQIRRLLAERDRNNKP